MPRVLAPTDEATSAVPRARPRGLRRLAFPLFALVMLVLPALPVPDFWITQSNYIGLYRWWRWGSCCSPRVAGLISFGQAAFVGVGAYTAAFMTVKLAASPWLALPAGIALAVLAALVLGAITLRMSGHYLPLATIAWAWPSTTRWPTWTGWASTTASSASPRCGCSGWTWAPAAGCTC